MVNKGSIKRAKAGAAVLACGATAVIALAGCSGSGSGGSTPSWAAALGPGAKVTPPGSAAPGNDSPGAAMTGLVNAVTSKNAQAMCPYFTPDLQARCQAAFSSAATRNAVSSQFAAMGIKNFKLGYVVTDGKQALVGTTGTACGPKDDPACSTNNDPAAIFNSGKPFATLFNTASSGSSGNSYALAPFTEVGGKWYLDISS